jgi:hypothetical protein
MPKRLIEFIVTTLTKRQQIKAAVVGWVAVDVMDGENNV